MAMFGSAGGSAALAPRRSVMAAERELAGTLTRADLAEALHKQVGLSRAESSQVVEQILRHLCEALSDGDNVKISGFGTFMVRDKGQRIGRNPKTGEEVPIAPRRVLTFRASQMMRDRIVRAG